MLEEFLDQKVVIDFRSQFVCLGTLRTDRKSVV